MSSNWKNDFIAHFFTLASNKINYGKHFESWLNIIFCEFCGNPESKVAGGARVQTHDPQIPSQVP